MISEVLKATNTLKVAGVVATPITILCRCLRGPFPLELRIRSWRYSMNVYSLAVYILYKHMKRRGWGMWRANVGSQAVIMFC